MKSLTVLGVFSLLTFTVHAQDFHLVYRQGPYADQTHARSTKVTFELQERKDDDQNVTHWLHATFNVISPKDYTLDPLPADGGPYSADVVEFFVAPKLPSGTTINPYFEFNLSPLDQFITAKIDDQGDNEKFVVKNFEHSVKRNEDNSGWDAEMFVQMEELGWQGDPATIIGNAFSILGSQGERHFFSTFLPVQAHPNFHKPEFFQALLPPPAQSNAPSNTQPNNN